MQHGKNTYLIDGCQNECVFYKTKITELKNRKSSYRLITVVTSQRQIECIQISTYKEKLKKNAFLTLEALLQIEKIDKNKWIQTFWMHLLDLLGWASMCISSSRQINLLDQLLRGCNQALIGLLKQGSTSLDFPPLPLMHSF